jgi:uncharacterized protein with ATP-grasp and redox domains
MKSWEREPESHLRVIDRVLELVELPAARKTLLRAELRRYMSGRVDGGGYLHPHVTHFHSEWYRELYAVVGVRDPFAAVKAKSHVQAEAILRDLGPAPGLKEALARSVWANWFDFGFFQFEEHLPATVKEYFLLTPERLAELQDLDRLVAECRTCRQLLLLTDNHGELVFDREVVRAVRAVNPHCRILLAGKGWPLLNDVTQKEMIDLGMAVDAELVSTGTNSFGVPWHEVSPEFQELFRSSDLILAKGQAHFEFWLEFAVPRLFNLVHVKIDVQDAVLGQLAPGTNLIVHADRYAAGKPVYPGA